MPIVDELIEVAVKHGAGKKQDYASDMTIADVFRRFAEKMREGSGGGDGPDGTALAPNSSYTVAGKFFLPSLTELDGEQNNNVAEGTVFQAFQNAGTSSSDLRVKYTKDGRPWYPWSTCNVRRVSGNGSPKVSGYACYRDDGFAAACVIKGA